MRRKLVVLILVFCSMAAAQPSARLQQKLQRIFASNEFRSAETRDRRLPGSAAPPRWTDDGRAYSTVESNEIVRYDPATGKRELLVSAAQLTPRQTGKPLVVDDYAWSADGQRLLVMTNRRRALVTKPAGEYWALDRASGAWRKLGGDRGAELLFAKFSPDASRVAYVRGTDLFVEEVATGAIRQLTSDGSDLIVNGTSDWVYDEEFSLRDGFRWSPDGRSIAYWQFDQHGVPEYSLVNYTDTLYPVIFRYAYPKAGQTNSAVRIGVVAAQGGPTRWVKTPGDPRNSYIPRMEWAEGGDLILQHLNRLQNTNDILLADARTGDVRTVFRDQDPAWVEVNDRMRWTQGRLLWTSERDGWNHAYTVSRAGEMRRVTGAAADVISIAGIDEAGGWLYYIASPEEPTRRYLYRARLDGSGHAERVTPQGLPGTHSYDVSPNGRWAIHRYARFDRPPSTDLVSLPGHKTARPLRDNAELRKKVADFAGGRTEFVRVDAGDGVTLDGWVMKPRSFDASKKYPIIVYVYGEPAGATATDAWFGNRTLFHAALADEGYIIATFDNSGTPSPRGRAWRKGIYGSIGVLASKQQAAALRSLAATRPWIDLQRVGVWGWSGGGSMTDNLMFRSPDLYKVGVAVAAVPDQALYDTIYQERYMGLPDSNAKGYHDGSPINFAEGLRGKLLIIHGTGDDNVHFQGNQRLINRLVELGKPFDFMEYPNRTHGLSEGKGTQLHVHTLIARYFEEHLPPGGK